MTIKYVFAIAVVGSSLLTSCMTSQNWVDDDVYVMKSVQIPPDTDVSDETDYNAFVYNKQNRSTQSSYYSDYFYRPYYSPWGMSSMMMMGPSFGMNNYGWGRTSGFGMGMGFGNPYMSSFGYGYGGYGYDPFYSGYYNPYYGYGYNPYGYGGGYYGYGYNPYGYGYGYGGGYYGNSGYGYGQGGTSASTGIHVTGPRGAISGYGGVRSHSPMAYRSATIPGGVTGPTYGRPDVTAATTGRTISKPVTTYDRVGRSTGNGSVTVSKTINNSPATVSGPSRSVGVTPVPSGGRTYSSTSVPRPATTIYRGSNSGSGGGNYGSNTYNSGASRSSGGTGGSYGGGTYNTNSGASRGGGGSYSTGSSVPRSSGGGGSYGGGSVGGGSGSGSVGGGGGGRSVGGRR